MTDHNPNNQNSVKNSDEDTEVYHPAKTQVLYSTLRDETPITPTVQTPVDTKIFDNLNSTNDQDRLKNQDNDIPISNASNTTPTLTRTPKSASLTDKRILAKSHQQLPNDDRLADETNAETNVTGTMIEQLGVATKHWFFTVNWARTSVPKLGLINKFKKATQFLDIDLSCLLCNRYGEVLERVWFKNMRDQAESVVHSGDELLGTHPTLPDSIDTTEAHKKTDYSDTAPAPMVAGEPDRAYNQERIALHLARIPPQIFHVVMLVSTYDGARLSAVSSGHGQLVDDEGNIICKLNLTTLPDDCSAVRMATLTRSGDSWRFNTDMMALTGYKLAELEQQISEAIVRTAK